MAVSLKKARGAKKQLDEIRLHLRSGKLDLPAAKLRAVPPLEILNLYMAKRAKDFGVRHRTTTLTAFLRSPI